MKLRKRGYTIIELLIGLIILGLLMQIGLVGYREFNRRQLAVSVTRKLEGDLRLAQQHANSGTKPGGFSCSDPNTFAGVLFEMPDRTSYSISALCSDGTSTQIKQVNLPNETELVRPSIHGFIFLPLAAGVDLSGETTIGVCAYGSEMDAIKVTPTGEISRAEITSCSESGGGGSSLPWLAQILYNLLGHDTFCLILGWRYPEICS